MPKYSITKSRYIDGVFWAATPEYPAIVELPVGHKIDAGLTPVDDEAKAEKAKLKPHYAPTKGQVPTAVEFNTKKAEAKPEAAVDAKKGKRASDSEAV